ncbi:MAG: type IV secretory system conjugative DNA transfer family protein, partial [Bacteroidaceae bacterium]|nr:type IV secretory system conjugative DNA transfer family protein [Bacteroidaceae bacterium]
MKQLNIKKLLILNIPYILVGAFATNFGEAWRIATGSNMSEKIQSLVLNGAFGQAFANPLPSLYPTDILVGIVCGAALRLAVYLKGKNAKKYRHNEEYGSARWGKHEDIAPFEDPEFSQNVILSQTERITMSSRPSRPKYARNKNVLVVGGSGSGKTRFFIKPNALQMNSSVVLVDPKGTVVNEIGTAMVKGGYDVKIFNCINFKKSMHYNPLAYIHDEKDILKLVTTLIANTKGEGNAGDPFWEKAEKLLYTALIGYIHYEAPIEEQNFSTLLEMINAMEVREDDEEFKNPVDLMFDELAERDPDHFAVRQFLKFKLSAGKTAKSILVS